MIPIINQGTKFVINNPNAWWRHQMETCFALLAFCDVTGILWRYWHFVTLLAFCDNEFTAQRPVTWSFEVFFDLRLNQQLSTQWRRRPSETPSRSLWRQCNGYQDVSSGICMKPWNGHPIKCLLSARWHNITSLYLLKIVALNVTRRCIPKCFPVFFEKYHVI